MTVRAFVLWEAMGLVGLGMMLWVGWFFWQIHTFAAAFGVAFFGFCSFGYCLWLFAGFAVWNEEHPRGTP